MKTGSKRNSNKSKLLICDTVESHFMGLQGKGRADFKLTRGQFEVPTILLSLKAWNRLPYASLDNFSGYQLQICYGIFVRYMQAFSLLDRENLLVFQIKEG